MKSAGSRHSIVVATKDQVSSDLGGEVAILDLKAGVYYGLDTVGARIWNLIQEPRAHFLRCVSLTNNVIVRTLRRPWFLSALSDLARLVEKDLIQNMEEYLGGSQSP
jgi:hypothetical protein